MKQLTCGLILVTKRNQIILVHSTNASWRSWSFPKGLIDEGETPAEAAARECYEETGIDLRTEISKFIDLGRHEFNHEKDAHFFLYHLEIDPWDDEEFNFICQSTFEQDGEQIPEIDCWKTVDISDVPNQLRGASKDLFEKLDLTGVQNVSL